MHNSPQIMRWQGTANEQYQEHSYMYKPEKERLGMALIEGKFPPTGLIPRNIIPSHSVSLHVHTFC